MLKSKNVKIFASSFCSGLCHSIWVCSLCAHLFLLQIVYWFVLPKLIREERIKLIMTVVLLMFLFQFLPKVYHSIILMRRMQKVTGYIFGTIWWGFGLNLIAYFIASHVSLPFIYHHSQVFKHCFWSWMNLLFPANRLLGVAGMFLQYNELLLASSNIVRETSAIYLCLALRRCVISFSHQRQQLKVRVVVIRLLHLGSHYAWMLKVHSPMASTSGLFQSFPAIQ